MKKLFPNILCLMFMNVFMLLSGTGSVGLAGAAGRRKI